MAQWNPYFGVPNPNNYEEQNLSSQSYYNVQSLPYGSVPIQQVNYNGYYVPNNVFSNFGTNLPGTVYNAHELEAQQFNCYTQNSSPSNSTSSNVVSSNVSSTDNKGAEETASHSKLTPTAAEFKPSSSSKPNVKVSSQTFYRNDNNTNVDKDENRGNKGAIRKQNKDLNLSNRNDEPSIDRDSSNITASGETGQPVHYRSNYDSRQENRKNYGRNNSDRSYNNDKYRSYNKYDRGNYNRNSNRREDYTQSDTVEQGDNLRSSNARQNNYRSDNKYTNKHENRDITYSRNTRREEYGRGDSAEQQHESVRQNQRQNDYRSDSRYNRYENRENNYGRNNRREEFNRDVSAESQNDSTKSSSQRHNDYSSKQDGKYNKHDNRENSYNRNYRDYSDRNNSERNSYSRDNYNRPVGKNNYRANSRYDKGYENWRSNQPAESQDKKTDNQKNKNNREEQSKSKPVDKERKQYRDPKTVDNNAADDDISQRDRLTEQVNRGTLECLVCCERVRQADKVWHCQKCYHIFHLRCISKWGNTSKDENGWRCPACQHVCTELPSIYRCYCGKMHDPPYTPGDTAHSCGDMCGRLGVKPGCVHRCSLLCHPGPCPKCEALVSRNCNCGATKQTVKCSADTILVCKAICNKILKCGVHSCEKICHGGDCDECLETIHQECYCGKVDRTIPCKEDQKDVKNYSCEQVCDKVLSCGNHNCKETCHPGECPPCVKAPDQVKCCPCGKTKLEIVRTSCLDPIPCCEKVCGRRYPLCGMPTEPHICKSPCHEGDCAPCPLSSFVRCRCGHMSCEISCSVLNSRTDDARCEKRCTKKRSCGRHKCNQLCCIDIDHICPLPCNHMLSCGQHRCEQTCHRGRCQPCWQTSFEELYCECGASVMYPPIPCGTKRPHCTRPCTRQHDCDHESLHSCHSQPECPPCTVLTAKICYGGHEKRTTIPCHQKEFSCGLPCGKELSCRRHKCQLACHKGDCLKEGQSCVQSCAVIRESCGHPCGLPCHEGPCPESPCKEMVKVTCQCGLRSSSRACVDMAGEYQRIATSMLASKMADMQLGHSIDIADIVGTTARKQTLKTLECNDECRLVERNRRLAIGLQIRNPDLSAKLTPRYSDFMRQWAKKDQSFCQMVHDKLTELVQLAKQSKQKSRSYSFPSMNREKRQFIHEYCEHFGCESAAYDQEPNRNVVATAARDKAWMPSCSLMELLQRENGQRKVPGPILNRPLGAPKAADIVSLKVPTSVKQSATATPSTSFASTVQRPTTPDTDNIDYFNFPPLNK